MTSTLKPTGAMTTNIKLYTVHIMSVSLKAMRLPLPLLLYPLPTIPPSSEPITIDDIAHGTNLNPILFDGEEEDILPPSLRQPIPDTSKNNKDHVDLTPPQDDPDPVSDHTSINEDNLMDFAPPEDPDPPSDHNDLNHHQNQIVPDEPQESNQQRHGLNETLRLEKAVQEVIDDELKSLKDMGVYKLVHQSELPHSTKIRKGLTILTNKIDANRHLARWKVWFVFKGYEQCWGVDYTSTTSPTACMESWRTLLHIAATLDWDAQQIDIKTAFLYRLLPDEEPKYMEQPKGFEEHGKETWVWQLKQGLYGMKQSGRIWNKTVNEAMVSWGFVRLSCESCIYYRKAESGIIIAAVHVNYFLSVADSPTENE